MHLHIVRMYYRMRYAKIFLKRKRGTTDANRRIAMSIAHYSAAEKLAFALYRPVSHYSRGRRDDFSRQLFCTVGRPLQARRTGSWLTVHPLARH